MVNRWRFLSRCFRDHTFCFLGSIFFAKSSRCTFGIRMSYPHCQYCFFAIIEYGQILERWTFCFRKAFAEVRIKSLSFCVRKKQLAECTGLFTRLSRTGTLDESSQDRFARFRNRGFSFRGGTVEKLPLSNQIRCLGPPLSLSYFLARTGGVVTVHKVSQRLDYLVGETWETLDVFDVNP